MFHNMLGNFMDIRSYPQLALSSSCLEKDITSDAVAEIINTDFGFVAGKY